ncbi:MAG: apolipoprotein N-acyltransferase, partial [Alteripontixanthobacter sp.]
MTSATELLARYPRLAALALGVVAATGFPPLNLWPLTLLSLAATIPLIRSADSWRGVFLHGWLFGVGHFTLANNWIATAFTYQAEMPSFLGWIAVPLLALYLAIYPALAFLAAWLVARRGPPLAMIAAFGASWIVSEWLRSWVFTGYAWDPLGLALLGPWDRPGLAAVLPWIGTYALSGLLVLLAGTLWLLVQEQRWLPLGIVSALLAAGMYLPAGEAQQGSVRFTLVQPDLRQPELDDASKFEEQFARITDLTARRNVDGERLV